jgi:hypothetical protein
MVDQATRVSETNGARRARAAGHDAGVSTLARDVWFLAQLQVQIVVAELQAKLRGLILPTVAVAGALALLLGCVPVLVLALAALLAYAGLATSLALLLAALIGMAIAVAVAWGGWYAIREALGGLTESRKELAENLASLRTAFSRDETSAGGKPC